MVPLRFKLGTKWEKGIRYPLNSRLSGPHIVSEHFGKTCLASALTRIWKFTNKFTRNNC